MHTVFALAPLFAELERRGWFPRGLALALGVLAVAAVGVLYVKEAGRLGVFARAVMAAVRMAIVLVVAFLLLRPVWVTEHKGEKARPVAVLIDVSESMDKKDPRPDPADQDRAARAMGLIDMAEPFPVPSITSRVPSDRLGERPSRLEVARAAITHPKVDLLGRLAKAGAVEVYTFGDRRTGRDTADREWLKTLKADEPRTALVDAAFELLAKDDAEAPGAIVLVTDGLDNASTRSLDALGRECARRKIPLYAYGVGSSSFGQLDAGFRLGKAEVKQSSVAASVAGGEAGTQLVAPSVLFLDDEASIPVRYTLKGVAAGTVRVTLKYGDRDVTPEKYKVDEPFSLTPEEQRDGKTVLQVLKFVPTKADADSKKQEYSVTVTVTSGTGPSAETITSTATKPAEVVNRKLKVLVVDSFPRYDFKYLQRALLRDRRVEARFYLTEGDRAAMRSGPPWMIDFSRELNGTLSMDQAEFRKTLFDFDLLILGDVPGKYFSPEHQQVIKEFVTEGGGLIHIAGRWHAPAAWAPDKGDKAAKPNPIAEVLPVEVEPVRFPVQALENPAPFVPVLAPGASRTSIVSLADDPLDNAELWGRFGPAAGLPGEKQLKPMYWFYPVTKTKPAADVFLVHPTARTPKPDDKPMPLLVGHLFGKGYVLYVGFDDTWRWRFNTQEELFGRFWTQAIYTAGFTRILGTKRTQIYRDDATPTYGKTMQVSVRALNENYQPLTAEEIEGTLENLDAGPNDKDRIVPVKLRRVDGSDGEYIATIPNNKPGQFRLSVDAKNKSKAEMTYPIPLPPNHERAARGMDAEALRKVCAATTPAGGKDQFYREETLPDLPSDVKSQPAKFTVRNEILLWNKWAMLLLIGLLTLEWFLRKFNGLS